MQAEMQGNYQPLAPSQAVRFAFARLGRKMARNLLTQLRQPYSGLLAAMTLGQTGYLSAEAKSIFRRAGISHLLVVSGLHLTLTAGVFLSRGKQRHFRAGALAAALTAEGCRAMICRADVSRREEVEEMVRRVADTFGPVSLLVNNAGIAGQCLFQDLTDERWHEFFSVNVDGAFYTSRAVLPAMLHEHEGCIVNISSIWGQRGASCEVAYSATKAAIIGLTRSLAAELAPSHIRVNCVAPGVIRTDMLNELPPELLPELAQQTPMGRLGRPEDIAAAVAFLADPAADFITGQVLTCDGGFIL